MKDERHQQDADGLHGHNEPLDPELARLERQLRSLRPRDLTPGMRQRMRELLGASSFGLVGGGRDGGEAGPFRWLGWALPLAAVMAIAFVMFREPPVEDPANAPDGPPTIVDKGAQSPQPAALDFPAIPAPSIALYRRASLHSEEALDQLLTQHGRALLTPAAVLSSPTMANEFQGEFQKDQPQDDQRLKR